MRRYLGLSVSAIASQRRRKPEKLESSRSKEPRYLVDNTQLKGYPFSDCMDSFSVSPS